MGLVVEVGVYGLRQDDPEAIAEMDREFALVNAQLREARMDEHVEPTSPGTDVTLSFDMFGYSGLHYLRRIAAYADAGRELPLPGDESASDDAMLRKYYDRIEAPRGLLARVLGRGPRFTNAFDHLMFHGDAEGYYLPADFRHVLFTADDRVAGAMIGSSPRLASECERLAALLGVPTTLDADADELWEAASAQGAGGDGWRRYGVESFTCIRLLAAANRSIATGAAIVFC